VLADQRMPGMDGLAFIRAVRADEDLRGARIVMISGAMSDEHAAAARAAGADAVLVKPVSPRALLETIERVMAP
ncbi:MAG: response regulator, partial [Phycisphaerales bacterium]|nr:response regulator [Hyphomonadaceae bacterium]